METDKQKEKTNPQQKPRRRKREELTAEQIAELKILRKEKNANRKLMQNEYVDNFKPTENNKGQLDFRKALQAHTEVEKQLLKSVQRLSMKSNSSNLANQLIMNNMAAKAAPMSGDSDECLMPDFAHSLFSQQLPAIAVNPMSTVSQLYASNVFQTSGNYDEYILTVDIHAPHKGVKIYGLASSARGSIGWQLIGIVPYNADVSKITDSLNAHWNITAQSSFVGTTSAFLQGVGRGFIMAAGLTPCNLDPVIGVEQNVAIPPHVTGLNSIAHPLSVFQPTCLYQIAKGADAVNSSEYSAQSLGRSNTDPSCIISLPRNSPLNLWGTSTAASSLYTTSQSDLGVYGQRRITFTVDATFLCIAPYTGPIAPTFFLQGYLSSPSGNDTVVFPVQFGSNDGGSSTSLLPNTLNGVLRKEFAFTMDLDSTSVFRVDTNTIVDFTQNPSVESTYQFDPATLAPAQGINGWSVACMFGPASSGWGNVVLSSCAVTVQSPGLSNLDGYNSCIALQGFGTTAQSISVNSHCAMSYELQTVNSMSFPKAQETIDWYDARTVLANYCKAGGLMVTQCTSEAPRISKAFSFRDLAGWVNKAHDIGKTIYNIAKPGFDLAAQVSKSNSLVPTPYGTSRRNFI